MNREILVRSKFGITESQRIGQAQSWLLAPAQARGVAAVNNLQATTQRSVVLQSISMSSDTRGGVVNASGLRVAGLSLNCGNNSIPIDVFAPVAGGSTSSQRTIGVALAQQQTVEVSTTMTGASNFSYCIGVQPNPTSMVPSTEGQADFFNYVVGLGQTGVIAAGANGQSTTTVLRGCWLGEVVFVDMLGGAGAPLTDIVLTDLTINGLSMLAGAANKQIKLDQLTEAQSNTQDFILNTWVDANSTIVVAYSNLNGAAATGDIGAAIFCKPYKKPIGSGYKPIVDARY